MESWNALQQFRIERSRRNLAATRLRRYLVDAQNPLEFFSEDEFRSRYRLSKDAVIYWVKILRIELASATNRGLPIPPLLQFTAVLRFFATGSFQIVPGDLEGLLNLLSVI